MVSDGVGRMSEEREQTARARSDVASGIAIVISTAALVVSVLQMNTHHAQSRAAVWPYLEVSRTLSEQRYSIQVNNRGVGPARVASVELSFDGVPAASMEALTQQLLGDELSGAELYRSSPLLGRVISPHEEVTFLDLSWSENTKKLAQSLDDSFALKVCYCSVYNECSLAELSKAPNQPISDCMQFPGALQH